MVLRTLFVFKCFRLVSCAWLCYNGCGSIQLNREEMRYDALLSVYSLIRRCIGSAQGLTADDACTERRRSAWKHISSAQALRVLSSFPYF